MVDLVRRNLLSHDQTADLLFDIFNVYDDDIEMVADIGGSLEAARDIDDLNAPPPEHPVFKSVATRLSEFSLSSRGRKIEEDVVEGLATTVRHMARQHDELAEKSYKRVVDLLPTTDWAHFNLGLFYKTRGRFLEGAAANAKAVDVCDDPGQAYFWNWGICATGEGDGNTALTIWKAQGQNIEMGRFGLPEGKYPSCKVRLAEFPLAERGIKNDHPGLEESVWVERLSPCHGIIRSVLVQDLGVNYGDVVLWDGAPYTYHKYGDQQIAVFPHLSTLRKHDYQFYDFAGTQEENGQLGSISADLDADAVVYVHTEHYHVLCATCFRDPDVDHETEEKHIVTGRIAAPPDMDPKDLLDQVDKAISSRTPSRIFSPDLCIAAGEADRARIEERRFEMLV